MSLAEGEELFMLDTYPLTAQVYGVSFGGVYGVEAPAQAALGFEEVHGESLLAQEMGRIQAAHATAYHQYVKSHATNFRRVRKSISYAKGKPRRSPRARRGFISWGPAHGGATGGCNTNLGQKSLNSKEAFFGTPPACGGRRA